MPEVQLKRIYDPAAKSDGARVLVDRIWPRECEQEACSAGSLDEGHRAIYRTSSMVQS